MNTPLGFAAFAGLTRQAALILLRRQLEAMGLGEGNEARVLLCHALEIDLTMLITAPNVLVNERSAVRLASILTRRLAHEPVARIIGHKEFYGLDFTLSPETLIPRPETELLVDLVLEAARDIQSADTPDTPRAPLQILDLGTGTGAILCALLAHLPRAQGVGVDLSSGAIRMAAHNAAALKLGARARFISSNWFEALKNNPEMPRQFDMIVSNPPYIREDEAPDLALEVAEFDPSRALYGGADGLEAYRDIIRTAPAYLAPHGLLALEIGTGQGRAVEALCAKAGFQTLQLHHDLAGHERVVLARLGATIGVS